MSKNVSYLYPITRVESLYHILRSTTHSAFPVAAPISCHGRPLQNVIYDHIPALYRDDFTLSNAVLSQTEDTTLSSPRLPLNPHSHPQQKRTTFKRAKHRSNNNPISKRTTDASNVMSSDSDYDYAYVFPVDKQQNGRQDPLALHGIVLRTQLVQLLSKRAFFNNDEQVRLRSLF